MLNRKWKGILIALIILAMAASFYVAYQRVAVERDNDNVEVAMVWTDFSSLAGKEDIAIDQALVDAQGSVTSFIFREMTVDELVRKNIAMNVTGMDLRSGVINGEYHISDSAGNTVEPGELPLDFKYLWMLEDEYTEPLLTNMSLKTNAEVIGYTIEALGTTYSLVAFDDVASEIPDLGMIFDFSAMEKASAAGYYVIPRFSTWPDYSEGDMAALVEPLAALNIGGIMFNEKSIIKVDSEENRAALIEDMAAGLQTLNAPLVLIEFYGQKGLTDLIDAFEGNMVRLHSINDDEMEKVTVPDSLNRFTLAINERNVRIAYIKSFPDSDFSSVMDYGAGLINKIENSGFDVGMVHTIKEIPQNKVVLLLIAFGIGAGAVFLGVRLRIPKIAAVLALVMIAGVLCLAFVGRGVLAARLLALIASLIFPTLAVITYVGSYPSLGKTLLVFLKMCGITLIGAVFIVGLLSLKPFMNSLSIFSGVKLAMVGPLLLILLYCLFLKERESIFQKTYGFIKQPVRYGELIILAVLALALLVLVLRSGNDGLEASSLELAFRTKLEQWLTVRPRTKEFLIGAPCMLLALYYGYKDYLVPLWLLGAIGQVSILNTFCHLHTPLSVSLLRTFNGLWLGIIIGIVAILVVNWIMKKIKKKMEGNVL